MSIELHPNQASLLNPKTTNKAELFKLLVQKLVATEPFKREGYDWAVRPQAWFAKELGVDPRTVRRLYDKAGLKYLQIMRHGKVVTLLRVGMAGDKKTPEDYARALSKAWQQKTGRRPTPKEFGLLVGLAKDIPEGYQKPVLLTALNNWEEFMGGVKYDIAKGKDGSDPFCDDPEQFKVLYFKFPTISVIRRFWTAAVELHCMKLQEQKTKVPESLMSIYSKI